MSTPTQHANTRPVRFTFGLKQIFYVVALVDVGNEPQSRPHSKKLTVLATSAYFFLIFLPCYSFTRTD